MSNNRDSVMSQVRLIQLQVFAAIEEANAGVAPERRVTPKSALTVVKRSLNSTRNLPFEVREFHAMRELSAFISLVQKNNFSDTFTNHTDLLTSAHPSSTRTHGLSASALSKAQLRWILSDSRISEEARPLLASMFTSPKTSAEYKYAEVRLSTLPRGSYPLEALTAAFGDGNSFIARRARALLQRRDRKGRFAFQGGGASALVERANGVVQRLTGRVVSQGENGDVVRIQLPNGRLVDIPTDGAEFIKAVIGKNNDGFSGVKAKYKAGDIILNEEDLEFFEAPHGFRKDESYAGPGTKYTDDEYDVVREANSFKISRREDGKSVGSAKNWADAQKAIFDDEPVADREAGREPIARLDQEQIDKMYDDPDFDPKDILTPKGAIFDEGADQGETSDTGEFKYNYPEGAYQLPLDVKYADGFADPANDSDDFTDDPKELAQKFSSEALVNALRKGLLPSDGSKANGEGILQFDRKEPVPVEAIYLALEEKGENARLEAAKIYDGLNGDKKNQEALARLEGAPAPKVVITPKETTAPESVDTPPLSEIEEEPSDPPAEPMRRGQVSPGGDWQWYPPVRMGGNQQAKGFWGRTEKGIAKLPPKEAKAPAAEKPKPIAPDTIGGGWGATNDVAGDNSPAYEKTVDGVDYMFVQDSDGKWGVVGMRNNERYLVDKEDRKVDVADPAAFDDIVAQIIDDKQKQNRAALKNLLTEQGFNEEVIGLVDEADAYEILAAVTADPAYADLQAKHERFMQGEQNAPFRAESKAFLDINSNLDKIRDNYEQPDVADAVTDVRGGIPTSSEIQRMLDGEGIGSQDEISGDAPSEVLPKAAKVVSGEKQEQDPEKRNAILDQLNGFAERANKALDLVEQLEPADEGMDTNRIRSAGESVNLAEDTLAEAMVNVDDASILDNDIQQAVFYLTEAINTLADVKSPEAPGVRSEILELRDELEAYRGSLESKPEVSPKDLKKEEKAVNVPDGIQKVVDELDAMEKALKDNLNELPLFQEEQNRLISAQLALFVARDTLNKAILNLNSRVDFVRLMDEAIGHIGSAVESLTSDELRMPEILEIKDSLKKLQQQFADAKFKHLESIPKDKTPIDDVVKNMLLGGELEVAVEDLVPNNEYTDVSPEAYAALKEKLKSAGFYGIQINDFNFVLEELFRQDIEVYYDRDGDPEMRRRVATIISDGGPEALGIDWPTEELFNEFSEELRDAVENVNLKEETPEVPAEAPVEAPATGRGRRVRNNNVAANRRWQARFGIKPPVFYKKNRGMFYDINGVPVNVGDKVTHNNPDKDEKYGEGVIISRIPNLGRWREARGEQVKVDYASYVWVQFANGKKAKLATRMLINKNPESVENPANVVKPVLDAEMPPPDVFIDDWKKFGKALAEFGVEPGKDARGNEGFQADAGNAQQMVISKDADGNYAVYLKEENIWRNRQVEPLFVTKSLPEAANYFIAEVHNRRYQTDFPANPVWAGDKAPTAVANPETNVVDVPEAGSVNNAGMPNAVNLDTDVDFEDLQKQIQDAIDNGQKIVFNYKGEDRLVTPKRIWTNPKNGNINLDAVGEDGFKVYTISNMENPNNPVEATPIPEVVIPEDVAPQVEDKPFLEDVSLEAQRDNAKKDFEDLGNKIVEKAVDGVGASDPEVAELYRLRDEALNRMVDLGKQIKQRDATPEGDPAERVEELKEEYKELGRNVLNLELEENPFAENDIEDMQKRMAEIRTEIELLRAKINEPKPDNQDPDAARAKQLEAIIAEFNETPENAQQDFEIINNDGKSVTIFDSRNGRQFEISWDENANIWASNPMGFERNAERKFFPNLNEAVDTAVTDLSKEREGKQGHDVTDFKRYVEDLKGQQFTRGSVQDQYDIANFDEDGILYIKDSENNNQANIVWDEDAQGYRVEFRPRDLVDPDAYVVYADIKEAGDYAVEILDKGRNKPESDQPKADSAWDPKNVDAVFELFPNDIKDYVNFSDNGMPEFHGGDDKNNYNDVYIEFPARGPNNAYQVVGVRQPDGTYRIFQVKQEDLGGNRWHANVIEQHLPADNYEDLVNRMVDAYRMLEAEVDNGEDLNNFFKHDDGYYDPEGKFYRRVGFVVDDLNPLAEKPVPGILRAMRPDIKKQPTLPKSLEEQLADAREEFENLDKDMREMYAEGIGYNDIAMQDLYKNRDEAFNKMIELNNIIKARDVAKEAPVERVVPIPRINVPEPPPVNAEDAKLLREIEAAKKDLANLKRQIGPQNRAKTSREKIFIQRIQTAQRELGKGNLERAKLYYDDALKRLNSGIAAYDANTYEDYKARMEKMAVIFGEDAPKPANVDVPLDGAPIEEVNPEKIAQERIAAGENISPVLNNFWKDELLNNEKLDELAQQGLDIRQYKNELQQFFAGEPKPMAQLSEDARFALQALLQRKIVNPRKTTDEKQNIKNIVELANALHNERLAYEPNDGANLDARGALLLQFSPDQMAKAAKNGRLVQNGQDLGFKVSLTGQGGGRTGDNKTYRIVDERTGKVYYYKKDTTKLNIDAELAALELSRALGLHGVYPAERHPTIDNVLVMGTAGQNLKLKEAPVVYGMAIPNSSDIVEKSPINQVFQFMILDAVMHNNDRHGQNWLVARPQDRGQKYNDLKYIPLPIDNGLGQIIDTNEARYGQEELNPMDYILTRNGANRNQGVANELLDHLGSAAFYEMMQLSTQQALQALRRSYPPGSNPDIDKLVARLEELQNADLKIWRR